MEDYIKSNRWNYTLKCGKALRDAIKAEDIPEIFNQLKRAYQELLAKGLIDEYDYEEYTEDFEFYSDEEDEETVDYELGDFYDLCDNLGVWVALD